MASSLATTELIIFSTGQICKWKALKKAEKDQRVTFEVMQGERGEKAGYVCLENGDGE